ncbi:bacteriophage T4 gp5 trimerisation domain-containing protein, partial [Serratia rubidaea]
LPAAATQMGFMTRSKDGHLDNSSHLYFEDKPGAEMLSMHAEKDMRVSVENNKDVTIDGTRTTTILKEQKDDVTGDAVFNYHATRTTTVDKKETKTFKDGEKTTITNGRDLEITSGGDLVKVKDKRDTTITGDETHHVTGKITQDFDSGQVTNIKAGGKTETITDGGLTVNVNGGDWTQDVTNGEIHISSPNLIKISSTSKVFIDTPDFVHNDKNKEIKSSKVNEFIKDHTSFKSVNAAVTGVSVSLNGSAISWTPLTISTSLTSVVTEPMNYVRSLSRIENSLQNVALSAIHIFI